MRRLDVGWLTVAVVAFAGCETVGRVDDLPVTAGEPSVDVVDDRVADVITRRQKRAEVALDSVARSLDWSIIDAYAREFRYARASSSQLELHNVSGYGELQHLLWDHLKADPELRALGLTLLGNDGQPFLSFYLTAQPPTVPEVHRGYDVRELADSVTVAREVPGYEIREQAWFLEAVARKEAVWVGPYYDMRAGLNWLLTRSMPLLEDGLVHAILTADLLVPPPDGVSPTFYGAMTGYSQPAPAYGRNPIPRGFYEGHAAPVGQVDSDSARTGLAWEGHLADWKAHSSRQYQVRREIAEAALDRLLPKLEADIAQVDRHPGVGYSLDTLYMQDPVYYRLLDYLDEYPDLLGATLTLFSDSGEPYFSMGHAGDRPFTGLGLVNHLDGYYKFDIRKHPSVALALTRKAPVWTEPYWDTRAELPGVRTVSRSVPLLRDGRVYAVVTTEMHAEPSRKVPRAVLDSDFRKHRRM
jgi:hypothetical protein